MKKIIGLVLLAIVLVFSASCAGGGEPVLSVSGLAEKSYTQKDLTEMEMMVSEYTNKDGDTTEYSGILIMDIMADAGVGDFSALALTASDGYSAEVFSEEITTCPDCVLSFKEGEGWRAVMPGFSGKLQVKDVVALEVK